MTMPLTQSIIPPDFTPTDFDQFLDEIGLKDATPETRGKLAFKAKEAMKYRVVKLMEERLSQEQLEEAAKLMAKASESGDYLELNSYLTKVMPDIDVLVQQAIDEIKDEIRMAAANLPATIQKFVDKYGSGASAKFDEMVQDVEQKTAETASSEPNKTQETASNDTSDNEVKEKKRSLVDDIAAFDPTNDPIAQRIREQRSTSTPDTVGTTEANVTAPPSSGEEPTENPAPSAAPFPWEEPVDQNPTTGDNATQINPADAQPFPWEVPDQPTTPPPVSTQQNTEPANPPAVSTPNEPATQADSASAQPDNWPGPESFINTAEPDAATAQPTNDKPADASDNSSQAMDDELNAIG